MDETRWLAAANPMHLLAFARRDLRATRTKAGRRKLRLFACGCCRRVWPALRPDQRAVVEAVERAADGRATQADVERAWATTQQGVLIPVVAGLLRGVLWRLMGWPPAAPSPPPPPPPTQPASVAALLARVSHRQAWVVANVWRAAAAADLTAARGTKPADEKRVQADLVRCLFGNPFRPPKFDPAWRTSTAIGLARAIYGEIAFDRLPILADALEDAGCDDEYLLRHCRVDAVHARGCWAVDLVLAGA
jgi:hypothetical protein